MFSQSYIIKYSYSPVMSSVMVMLIVAFMGNIVFDSINLIIEDTHTTMELCDSKDIESSESSDAENKVEVNAQSLLSCLLDLTNSEMNWSASSYFSELHAEILTPPPDELA